MNGGSTVCDVLIAVYMTYLVRTPRFYMYYFFLIFNSQLSQRKSDSKQTQRSIQKVMRLTIGTGMLIGQEIALVIFSTPNSDHVFQLVQPSSKSLTSSCF